MFSAVELGESGFKRVCEAPSYYAGRHLAVRKRRNELPFRIDQTLLDCTFYLYSDMAAAEASAQSGGSGFLLGWAMPDGSSGYTLWAVTNRHVVERGHWTIRINSKLGGTALIDTDDTEWILHPSSDLAIRPIQLSQDMHRFKFITDDWVPEKSHFDTLDIGPGDACFTIGRFVGHDGKSQNNPTVRFGQISQNPIEPVDLDGVKQECYLVESRSISGSSGSPVFVHLDSQYYRPTINMRQLNGQTLGQGAFPNGPWLLGVAFAMVPLHETICDKNGINTGHRVAMNTGMMAVVPAWHIREMIETGSAAAIRAAIETAVRADSAAPVVIPTAELRP